MGLDQSGFLGGEKVIDDEGRHVVEGSFDMGWRKHARLQEFMENLWDEKNEEGSLNCSYLQLNERDLLRLQKAIENGYANYECEGGLFWGHEFQEEAAQEYKKQDLEFADAGLKCVRNGQLVHYSCWW